MDVLKSRFVRFVRADQVDWQEYTTVKRAGIIPYILINDEVYWIMGHDERSGEWTDFGGHSYANELAHQCAMRELSEESLGVFDHFFRQERRKVRGEKFFPTIGEDLNRCTALVSTRMVIFFCPLDIHSMDEFDKLRLVFHQNLLDMRQQKKPVENDDIQVFRMRDLKCERVYKRVRDLLEYRWGNLEQYFEVHADPGYFRSYTPLLKVGT